MHTFTCTCKHAHTHTHTHTHVHVLQSTHTHIYIHIQGSLPIPAIVSSPTSPTNPSQPSTVLTIPLNLNLTLPTLIKLYSMIFAMEDISVHMMLPGQVIRILEQLQMQRMLRFNELWSCRYQVSLQRSYEAGICTIAIIVKKAFK